MKNSGFIIFIILTSFALIWVACGDKEFAISEDLELVDSSKRLLDINVKAQVQVNTVTLTCAGTCDCHLEGKGLNWPPTVSCSCADCTMTIVFRNAAGEVTHTEIVEGNNMEMPYMNDFMVYMEESYPNETYELRAIEINEEANNPSYSYLYDLSNGTSGDVLFAQKEEKKWTIDCNGNCGCRSQFTASDPPQASCSCADCTLVATSETQTNEKQAQDVKFTQDLN